MSKKTKTKEDLEIEKRIEESEKRIEEIKKSMPLYEKSESNFRNAELSDIRGLLAGLEKGRELLLKGRREHWYREGFWRGLKTAIFEEQNINEKTV